MKEIIHSLPDQILQTIDLLNDLRGGIKRHNRLLICGMGGSGISGEILSALYPKIQIITNKDYDIPEYIDRKTLAVLVSYSGNTEETLTNYRVLVKRKITAMAISSDGLLLGKKLKGMIRIPKGLPPRGAVGYLFTPLPFILYKWGLIRTDPRPMLRALALYLREERKRLDTLSRKFARQFTGKLPVIYANSAAFAAVANRWRCQLNENAKILCHANIIPEMNHNEIVGVGSPRKLNRDILYAFLNDPAAHPRNKIRVRIVKEILKKNIRGVQILDINPRGTNRIQRMFWTIMLGDLLSYYLAVKSGIDPLPVKRIDYLKRRLVNPK